MMGNAESNANYTEQYKRPQVPDPDTEVEAGPSLLDLRDPRVRPCLEESGLDTRVLDDYFETAQTKWSDNSYYLGGQTRLRQESRISTSRLTKTHEVITKKRIEYGEAVNGLEYLSMQRSDVFFEQMIQILEFVKGDDFRAPEESSEDAIDRFLAWYYRPGGDEYKRIAARNEPTYDQLCKRIDEVD